jgi:gliding motility-associated-like protein
LVQVFKTGRPFFHSEKRLSKFITIPIMRKILTALFLLSSILVFAQPANDDCGGIIDLGVAPWCDETVFFDNIEATPTDIGADNIPAINDCSGLGPMQNDVWFVFIASDTIDEYVIDVIGITDGMGSTPMQNPQVAIYRGDCEFDGLQLLDCAAADLGESSVTLNVADLTPGLPYFLRITDYSDSGADFEGTFQLCIEELTDIPLCDDVTTTACTGVFYDCGGPDGDYGPNEDVTLTIMPPAPVGCITLTLDYFNIEDFSESLTFYDGPDTNSPVITTISGGGFGGPDGGGGVCFQVQATSGALTMQFTSDGFVEFEGFAGSWECSPVACEPFELINGVSTGVTETDIINTLATPFTSVTVTDINCADGAYGTFTAGDQTDLGLSKGIVLTSGQVEDAGFGIGINHPGADFASTGNGFPGDPDLDFLSQQSGGSNSQDACVIELDVFAATDVLSFEYVFGSEEYPEYVGSSFNDIFAFLVSGPGIVGVPGLNNQENIAVLPAPGTGVVEINNVNNFTNWEFYRNNQVGPSVVYDGLTSDYLGTKKSLTAEIEVTPCNTYHLKLAISDRGDTAFDSGVFISELKGGTPEINVNYNNGIEYLVEECTENPDEIVITLSGPQDEEVTYDVVVLGTATPGVDYTLTIPAEITFQPGETEVVFPIEALADGIPEGVETVEIYLQNDFGCGTVDFAEIIIEIYDELEVEIFAGEDTTFVCDGSSVIMDVTGAVTYFWTPSSIFDPATGQNPTATPTEDILVFVVGQLGVCTAVDSVFLDVVSPDVSILAQGETNICQGDSVELLAINNVGDSNLEWTPASGLSDPFANPVVATPLVNTTYTVNVELEGCGATGEITVNVDPFVETELAFANDTICESYSVVLADPVAAGSGTTYQWTPVDFLDDPDIPDATATPDPGSYTYTLITTSPNGYCADTMSLNLEVLPAGLEIVDPVADTLEICLGESVNLTALTSTPGMGFSWSPDDGSLTSTTDESVIATPLISTNYLATLNVGQCEVFDSVYIRVDSIPDTDLIELIPQKDSYCEGELVTFVFPAYEPANFPDIMHEWTPDLGLQSPDSLWNLVILTQETATYTRITNNRGCVDTTEVLIEVVPTAEILIDPENPSICFGEDVQLTASSDDPIEDWMWSPSSTLDCDDCPDPVASPNVTTEYTVEGVFDGCPTSATVTVEVEEVDLPNLPADPTTICPGESILLNDVVDPDASYTWLENGSVVSNDPEFEPTPGESTTYTLLLAKGDCEEEFEVTVNVSPTPTLSIGNDTLICIGNSVILTASSNVEGTYSWSPDVPDIQNPEVTPLVPTTYELVFTDDAECLAAPLTGSIFVDVTEGFDITELTASPDSTFENNPIQLAVTTDPPVLNNPIYDWVYDGAMIGSSDPVISILAPDVDDPNGEEVVYSVTITDALGCSQTAEVSVFVEDSFLEVPTAFSPNGDGTNDIFQPVKNDGVLIIEFRVYNRWGQLVYDITEDGGDGWDGTVDGEPAPSDVYAFYLVYRNGINGESVVWGDNDTEEKPEHREVTLLR